MRFFFNAAVHANKGSVSHFAGTRKRDMTGNHAMCANPAIMSHAGSRLNQRIFANHHVAGDKIPDADNRPCTDLAVLRYRYIGMNQGRQRSGRFNFMGQLFSQYWLTNPNHDLTICRTVVIAKNRRPHDFLLRGNIINKENGVPALSCKIYLLSHDIHFPS